MRREKKVWVVGTCMVVLLVLGLCPILVDIKGIWLGIYISVITAIVAVMVAFVYSLHLQNKSSPCTQTVKQRDRVTTSEHNVPPSGVTFSSYYRETDNPSFPVEEDRYDREYSHTTRDLHTNARRLPTPTGESHLPPEIQPSESVSGATVLDPETEVPEQQMAILPSAEPELLDQNGLDVTWSAYLRNHVEGLRIWTSSTLGGFWTNMFSRSDFGHDHILTQDVEMDSIRSDSVSEDGRSIYQSALDIMFPGPTSDESPSCHDVAAAPVRSTTSRASNSEDQTPLYEPPRNSQILAELSSRQNIGITSENSENGPLLSESVANISILDELPSALMTPVRTTTLHGHDGLPLYETAVNMTSPQIIDELPSIGITSQIAPGSSNSEDGPLLSEYVVNMPSAPILDEFRGVDMTSVRTTTLQDNDGLPLYEAAVNMTSPQIMDELPSYHDATTNFTSNVS